MNRREFLIAAGVCLGSMVQSGCGGGDENNPAGDVPSSGGSGGSPDKIIVIGAGMAGLASARKLHDAGKDVMVLEARDRTGGRLFTSAKWHDAKVDLGATWIHGDGDANPIAKLARQLPARLVASSLSNDMTIDTNGTALGSAGEAQLDSLLASIKAALAAAKKTGVEISVQDAVRNGTNYANRSTVERNRIDFLVNTTIEQEYSGEASRLSTLWYDSDDVYAGTDSLFIDGYQVLVDYLAQDLDIRLGQVVKAISVLPDGNVVVNTNQGSFTAQRVLVTLPLGVLQSGAVSFSPALPADKQQAIATLGSGLLNKCCLRFPSTFWDASADWINYVPDSAQYGHWAEWFSLARPTGQSILMGFNAAAFAREIESWSDKQIIDSAMSTLRTMYGNSIPDPADFLITRWGTDPFALGSYSFNALGATPAMRTDLARNIGGRLFFAGEATEESYFQTVHGAYQSGQRAADEILAV